MNMSPDDVEQTLEELRGMGAVTEVQGSGRVAKYRHHAYEWLGVEKTELAVMTELLLRGEQTLGELRGRAARMEPIADLAALKPVVDSLVTKGSDGRADRRPAAARSSATISTRSAS